MNKNKWEVKKFILKVSLKNLINPFCHFSLYNSKNITCPLVKP